MNDNHDELGRFASGSSAMGATAKADSMARSGAHPDAVAAAHREAASLHDSASKDPGNPMGESHAELAKDHAAQAKRIEKAQKIVGDLKEKISEAQSKLGQLAEESKAAAQKSADAHAALDKEFGDKRSEIASAHAENMKRIDEKFKAKRAALEAKRKAR